MNDSNIDQKKRKRQKITYSTFHYRDQTYDYYLFCYIFFFSFFFSPKKMIFGSDIAVFNPNAGKKCSAKRKEKGKQSRKQCVFVDSHGIPPGYSRTVCVVIALYLAVRENKRLANRLPTPKVLHITFFDGSTKNMLRSERWERQRDCAVFRIKQTKRYEKHETTSKKESDECLFIKLKLHDINWIFRQQPTHMLSFCVLYVSSCVSLFRILWSDRARTPVYHTHNFCCWSSVFAHAIFFFCCQFFFLFNSLRSFLLSLDESGVYISDHLTTSNQKKEEKKNTA